jgi:glyoxylase-like metal-dependent hydrolase (beta-lactamase superfamily II)
MHQIIHRIKVGSANCYLIRTNDDHFILVDTSISTLRARLLLELKKAGCRPGNLKLILLTHGDPDHAGNCAFLREKYRAESAIHRDDVGMVKTGNTAWNRKVRPDRISKIFAILITLLGKLNRDNQFETFTPNLLLEDGQDLNEYGWKARVLHLPGHSKGSVGILTIGGDLICGDLIYNFGRPASYFIDDLAAYRASLEKLKGLAIKIVYPGHGWPFPWNDFLNSLGQ